MKLNFIFLFFLMLNTIQAQDSTKVVTSNTGRTQEILAIDDHNILESDPIVDSIKIHLKYLKDWQIQTSLNETLNYNNNYNNVINALNIINEVNKTYDALYKDRRTAEAYNILISVNNPESEVLGFKFSDIVLKSVTKRLDSVDDLKGNDKTLFTQGITKLVNGISSLINPTNLIGSAITFISSFVPSRIQTALKDPLGKDFIDKFKEDQKPYILYYSTLDRYNGIFNEDLYNLDSKHSNLKRDINNYIRNYVTEIHIDLNQPITSQVNTIFEFSNSGKTTFNHAAYNSKSEINKVIQSLPELKLLVSKLNDYYEDYNRIILQNFSRNIQLLESAKELPDAKVSSIQKLEAALSELLNGKSNDSENGFSTKFKQNITQLSNYVRAFK
ncbi:hypothetical protein ACS386_08700 [Flavobacteriaceae bacterium LMO-SS05]